MSPALLSDTTLVVVGHGSTVNTDSAASIRQHVTMLRKQGEFAAVQEAFWKVAPFIPDVLAAVATPRVAVVPFFVSEGWFTEEAIPQALGLRVEGQESFARRQTLHGRELFYARPVGTHPAMTEVILARAAGVLRQFPFPREPRPAEVALLLAGHGTERNAASRQSVEDQAELIRARGMYREVHAVFMLEAPRVQDYATLTEARQIVVVPFFMSDGLHVTEDIPVLLGEPERIVKERLARGLPGWRNPTEKQGRRVWYSGSVGTEPSLAKVILERAREALSPAQLAS